MDKIRLLSQTIANRIAAGEVVTHPAAVIKEMMENSIDAGATEVIVNYRRAGYELMQIVDNGAGMSPNDARMAFERHATSKLRRADDLYDLHTFGFRGEALASIAAVSKVELKSRLRGAKMGTVTIVENGNCVDQRAEMCEEGSQFFVREIFQDTPARRRFMDKDSKSSAQLVREFRRVALCYESVAFELHGDGAPVYKLAPTTLLGRIVDVIGRSTKTKLLDVKVDTKIVKIRGYIGNEKSAKKRNQDQYMFVNGRYFESSYFTSALMRGYEKIIQPKTSPSYFLYFEVDPKDVDINRHPQKIDIKFAEAESIWMILYAAVRESLARTGVVSMMDFDESSNMEIPVVEHGKVYEEPKAISNAGYNPFDIERETMAVEPKDELDVVSHSYAMPSVKSGRVKRSALHDSADGSWEDGFDIVESSVNLSHEYDEYESVQAVQPGDTEQFVQPMHSEQAAYSHDDMWQSVMVEDEQSSVAELPLSSASVEPERDGSEIGAEQVSDQEGVERGEVDGIESIGGCEVGDISVTHGRYGWCKLAGNMCVVDLKRARERSLYDLYCSTIGRGDSISQRTFFPMLEQLSMVDFQVVADNVEEFAAAGFIIELRSEGRIEILGVPAGLKDDVAAKLIHEIIALLETPEDVVESRRERIAQIMARRGAVGLGRNISTQQAREVVNQLLKAKCNARTADGRAIIWVVTPDEIKRRLK